MTEIDNNQTPQVKLYKDKWMYAAAFVGGPLAAGYIIAENFKLLNEREKYKRTWLITILVAVLIFGGIFLIPDSVHIPGYMIPIAYSYTAFGLMKHYQGKQIEEHENNGGKTYSGWRSFLIGLIALAITLAVLFPIAFWVILVQSH
ncbi:MAG: hypothetical protein JWP12_1753 [Bacteroidetes bacterium]|nr:hypothetical protein [Bacteroidota bacterium]